MVTRSPDPNCCVHINKTWIRRWNWNYSISSHKVGIIIIPWINFVLYQKQKFIAHSEYNFDIQRIRQSVILPKIVVNIHEMEIIPCSCTCLVKHSRNQLGPDILCLYHRLTYRIKYTYWDMLSRSSPLATTQGVPMPCCILQWQFQEEICCYFEIIFP